MKTFFIATFGCRTNQAESRVIGEQLNLLGFYPAKNFQADLVIVNSCAITQKAEKEVNQFVRRVKRENPKGLLIVTGCFTGKNKIAKKSLISYIKNQYSNIAIEQFNNKKTYKDKYFRSNKAIVKIQDGCNNFCTYCIVPYLRGRSVSKSRQEIIKEIQTLENKKITEIILTGIDIADYQDLTGLLTEILQKTETNISFGSVNINAFTPEFIDLIKKNPRITRHFHIPLQSGCDATLKRMNRKYSFSNFGFRISDLKKKIPGFTLSTDIIVGFPGETDGEFDESLRSLKSLKSLITKLHVFRYSKRAGTSAARMENKWGKVNFETKKVRWQKIKNLGIKM